MALLLKDLTFKSKNQDISASCTLPRVGCQKKQQDLRNLDLEVYCANIQPKLKELRSSTTNQSFFMASGGFLKFIQYWLNISALTQQICF